MEGCRAKPSQEDCPISQVEPGEMERKARVDAIWQQMNKGVSAKTLKSISENKSSTTSKSPQKSSTNKSSAGWMNYLGLGSKKAPSTTGQGVLGKRDTTENVSNVDANKKLAAAALSAVKDAAALATIGRGKVEVTEVRDFAGEDIEVKKLVDAAEKGKGTTSAVDAVLEQIKKKTKLSVLDKTKDWGEFKGEHKGMEDELDAYKKSSNQYLDKVSFLERTDYREFERERDVRLASLRDVSNAKTVMKSANVAKVVSNDDGEPAGEGDYSLDRLLLVQSDLSSLLRQIDVLVVLALQWPSNKGRKEIEQFADVLSEMHTSLKPWVPRFQKALLSQSNEPENKPVQPIERTVTSDLKESTNADVESPEETKWESLVSPSPLVSWRAECNTVGGRQLFLLTPLPQQKALSSKIQDNDLSKGVPLKPAPNIDFSIEVTKDVDNHQTDCGSPDKFSNDDCSLFLMTPCLKMSPIKSCVLLEPISEISMKQNRRVHKCTPFPIGVNNSSEFEDSGSSSGQCLDDLKLNYPELKGIKTENLRMGMVEDDSPNWIVSPPKTCIIMEPSDERQENQDIIGAVDLAEHTPMIKEPMSSFRMGKHPGENTLKKELWTKFEAASTHGICFNTSHLQTTTKKGFLDQLDEASDA